MLAVAKVAAVVTSNLNLRRIPVGTVVTLNLYSELAPDQTLICNPLAGTIASSTATCSATFPYSFTRILASANW